jgi:hypothetical protein
MEQSLNFRSVKRGRLIPPSGYDDSHIIEVTADIKSCRWARAARFTATALKAYAKFIVFHNSTKRWGKHVLQPGEPPFPEFSTDQPLQRFRSQARGMFAKTRSQLRDDHAPLVFFRHERMSAQFHNAIFESSSLHRTECYNWNPPPIRCIG